jgi:hypothetical protein
MKFFFNCAWILTLILIIGCVKATKEFDRYQEYQNSATGLIEGFFRGVQSGLNGDPLGTAFAQLDRERQLAAIKDRLHFWAWVGIAATIVLLVMAGNRSKQSSQNS